MKHLVKGKEFVGVADDPEEASHAHFLKEGFKPAPEGWEPPAPKADNPGKEPEPVKKKARKKKGGKKG